MISVEEATQRIVAAFAPLEAETVAIANAAGRVLAEDVAAKTKQPPFPVSSMDGYAVCAADVQSAPATLRIVGSAPAGHPFVGKISKGEAVRIFTGGVVPEGADAIVIQENTEIASDTVQIKSSTKSGQHIRATGLDFKRGDVLAKRGARLSARDLSLLAAADVAQVNVHKKPVVAFVATGDELSRPGEPRKAGGIVASSGYGLGAMMEKWGATPRDLGILPDNAQAISGIAENAKDADVIVTLGGASVGDHDLVQSALGPKGFALDFWKIAMRPGKPLIFGRLGKTPLLGLPGNPVSSLVCAILFLQPAIAAMLGADTMSSKRRAKLAVPLAANDARQDYLRARTSMRQGELFVEAFAVQDSSMLKILADADVLIVRAPNAVYANAGDSVEVIPLD